VLYAYKHLKDYPLKSSTDKDGDIICQDLSFKIMKANPELFKESDVGAVNLQLQKDDEDAALEFNTEVKNKEIVNVVMLKSKIKKKIILAPILKKKAERNRDITGMLLLTGDKSKEIDLEEDVDYATEGRFLNAFYARSEEFGEAKNYFAKVQQQGIKIYNADNELVDTYKGLNLQAAINVHQGYMYTI
jgi:hypothetical protein